MPVLKKEEGLILAGGPSSPMYNKKKNGLGQRGTKLINRQSLILLPQFSSVLGSGSQRGQTGQNRTDSGQANEAGLGVDLG
jgi:molybdopterin-guanine dinucleotide biosynthesis protein A